MTCPVDRETLSAYIDGEMDVSMQARIREHLRICERCCTEVRSLKLVAQMVSDLPRFAPPAAAAWSAAPLGATPEERLRCPVVLPAASALIDGELPSEQTQAVMAHLATCDPCYRAYKDIERVSEILTNTPAVPVPSGLQERILAALEAERHASWRRFFRTAAERIVPAAAVVRHLAAAAILVLAITLVVGYAIRTGSVRSFESVPTASVVRLPDDVSHPPEPTYRTSTTNKMAAVPSGVPRIAAFGAVSSSPRVHADATPRMVSRPILRSSDSAKTEISSSVDDSSISAPSVEPPPLRPSLPHPAPAGSRELLVSQPPMTQPDVMPVPTTPATSRPDNLVAKSSPGVETSSPEAPKFPLPARVASLPEMSTPEDVDVHVPRSRPLEISGATGALDPELIRAAEQRLRETVRDLSRSQPRGWIINP
ncbi:MAG: zf-HC2 domain-containing protein [Candidatus Zipacnadales bacterium]